MTLSKGISTKIPVTIYPSMRTVSLFLLLILLAACTPATMAAVPSVTAAPVTTATATTAAPTDTPSQTPTTAPSPTVTFTSTPPAVVCSPMQGVPLADLPERITNPYHPPAPGSDDPHHGVDLGDFLAGSRVAITGLTVQAAIRGRVAAVIQNRFPYGYAVIIETPLEAMPMSLDPAAIPTPAPTLALNTPLTCPAAPPLEAADPQKRSLYVLYAHMKEPPLVSVEDEVTCGQAIGVIGDSGNALNPHLHFEARVAPAGLRLGSIAHYDASATAEEMNRYCLWRISGRFQLVDPMQILH